MRHDGAGYGRKTPEGESIPVTLHSVFVMDVESNLMRKPVMYLEAFTCAKKLR